MMPLNSHEVLALGGFERGALARFLASLGATVRGIDIDAIGQSLPRASFLIENLGCPSLSRAGWPAERLRSSNPRLIHASVTTFGSAGPRAHWRGSELVASAMGGTLRLTGEPDRPPVKEALDACRFHAELCAAAGVMAAHFERGQSGRGQHIDVSVQEVALSRNVNGILVWQFDRRKLARVGAALNYGRATVRCIWPLLDGWCFHTLMTGAFGAPANRALSDWIDACGLENPMRGTDWSRYNRSTLDPGVRRTWESAIEAFFRTRSSAEIRDEGRRRGIHATVIASPEEVLADPHLQAREFWAGPPGRRTPARFVRFASGPGTADPAAGTSAAAQTSPVPEPERSGSRIANQRGTGPLAGIRVLDFSWALVGSITTKVLGDLGADVIKVESRTRPCLSRIDVQVSASRADSFDDKPWFAHLNSSKRSLALDLKKPESREVLLPLVRWADLVVENFSPGTMAKLGLDYAELCRLNPRIVLVSGSVFGQTGPLAQEWGVDGTGAALSGRTYLTGWPDRGPVIPGAVPYGDVIVPYAMAAASAAALQHRRESGRGCHIDAAMYEICVQQTHEAIARAQTPDPMHRMGNQDPGLFHQGVYPVAGEDRWIAITAATPEDWRHLLDEVGLPGSADLSAADAQFAAWSAGQTGEALLERLQAAGVCAGLVQDVEDLLEHDPQIAHRGSLVSLPHALLGSFGHVRTPIDFSGWRLAPYQAPRLGEHSRSIASELAGLSEHRIDELEQMGVFR